MGLFKGLLSSKRKANRVSSQESGGRPEAEVERFGLFLLKDETAALNNLDIIAVHGLGGHYRRTWSESNGKFWLSDSVPSKLRDFGLNSRVFSYGYDSSTAFSKAVTDITDEAAMLLERIRGERKSQSDRHKPIIFIAHSLGGILVKKAMIIAHERSREYGDLLHSIKGAMFFGTPHRGSDAAYWAAYATRVLRVIQLGRGTNDAFVCALQRNSEVFANISEQWVERAAPLRIRTFYETERLYGELVVDKDSARLGIVNEVAIGIAGSDHKSMCKFGDFDSQKYKPVWNAIEELAEHALGGSGTSITGRLNKEDYAKKLVLLSGVKVAKSNPPISVSQSCEDRATEESLEWLTKSAEYEMWKKSKDGASLWLHGRPGDGKTMASAYVLGSLSRQPIYTKKRLVASVFCSRDDSDIGLVTALALQLILQDEDRAHAVQETMAITDFQKDKHSDKEIGRNMWKLLETLIVTGQDCEAIIIIDGIDEVGINLRTSFLESFFTLQANIPQSVVLRVLMSSRPHVDIKRALAHYSDIEKDKERKECLATLFFQEWNARETRVESIAKGGSWLSTNDAYQRWVSDPTQTLLWIEGKPGSGKSTLAKHIVRKMREERTTSSQAAKNNQAHSHNDQDIPALENEAAIIAEFYYSFRGGYKETSHELMLRSIVYQIWKQNYRLFPLIRDQYRRLKLKAAVVWTCEDLKSALDSLHLIEFDLRVLIVVDAMDESENCNRTEVLQFLHLLSSYKTNRSSRCSIKLLVASRPEIKPDPGIGAYAHIILQKENDVDIRIVVSNWIDNIGISDHHLLSEIHDYIMKHSAGVFLWVSLVLRDLGVYIKSGGYRPTRLRAYLRGLPKELGGRDGYYRAMVSSLIKRDDQTVDQRERMEDGQRILAWTTFSKRPLLLSELTDVLAAPADSKRMNPSNEDLADDRPRDLDRGILSFCGGLVELRETPSGQIVQLIHLTVREFLLDQNPPPPAEPYDLDEARGDFEIANTCFRYLRIVFEPKILLEVDPEFSHAKEMAVHLSNYPLLTYAIDHFKDHFHHLDSGIKFTSIRRELEVFVMGLGQKKSYSSLLLLRWIQNLTWTTLYLDVDEASARNCLNCVLSWAAEAGKDEAVKALLALGADIDSQGNQHTTPLMNAAQYHHTSTVKLLIEKSADVSAYGREHSTALQVASSTGHEQIVKLLLDAGAEVNAYGPEHGTALQAASFTGHEQIVKLLLAAGADVNAYGGEHSTALQAASFAGHEQIVKLLLAADADVNAYGAEHGNALHVASSTGHEQIVKLLLAAGADVNVYGGEHSTALQAASFTGHEQIVKLLLDAGAEVNAYGAEHGTALHAASSTGHEQIMKLLLDAGADVNTRFYRVKN